jgi:hypothetical protein
MAFAWARISSGATSMSCQRFTGLLYDDLAITGGPIVNEAFVGGQLLPSDEGKLRAEGHFRDEL